MMIDPDIIKLKAKEYVRNLFSDIIEKGTLILYEPKLSCDEMREILLLHGVKCPEVKRRSFAFYSPMPCYIIDDVRYSYKYGTKLKGLFVRYADTFDGYDVTLYLEGDEESILSVASDLIIQYAIFYSKSIFEAYSRAFVFDDDAIIIIGPNDPPTFRSILYAFSGGRDYVRQMYILVNDILVAKVPKEDLLPLPFDAISIYRVSNMVFYNAISREDIYKMVVANYEAMRSKLFMILSRNDEIMKVVEQVFEEASKTEVGTDDRPV